MDANDGQNDPDQTGDGVTDDDPLMQAQTVMDPVTDTNGRTADFNARSDWERNPAAEWVADTLEGGAPADAFWTYSFDSADEGQTLPGGRKLHLDLRSDLDPNYMELGTSHQIARGPGTADASPDPWTDVTGIDLNDQSEIDLGRDSRNRPRRDVPGHQGQVPLRGGRHCQQHLPDQPAYGWDAVRIGK